jgi:SAM-dependent methyltransferase
MNFLDLVRRKTSPEPWAEGEKIPWDDPAFSQRMLHEHLSQDHDAASRRFQLIDQQVTWIHTHLLPDRSARILDLGCGPGLYTLRLAALGHDCAGIDFSPASIDYAREQAARVGAACSYMLEDIRRAGYGTGYDLVMLIFGEFNVFHMSDTAIILRKAYQALAPGGILLLEPHTYDAVREIGGQKRWYSSESDLFSDSPHLQLYESIWDETHGATTERYYVVDAVTGEITPHAASMQAYTNDEYLSLLVTNGFADMAFYPSLTGEVSESQRTLVAIVAEKRGQS